MKTKHTCGTTKPAHRTGVGGGHARLPAPKPTTYEQMASGSDDSQFVEFTGPVRSIQFLEEWQLYQIELSTGGGRLSVYARQLPVTGICRIDPGDWIAGKNWRAKSFRIMLRSIGDVRILQSPSWSNLQRVLWIATAASVVAFAAFTWVGVLRRKVTERGRQLELEIQERQFAERRGEIEQERTCVAQNLHDELGATLTEMSLLGTLARTQALPSADREHYLDRLTHKSRAVVGTFDEIVWAVNPKYDSVADLASYYSLFAQRFQFFKA